jgi:hypothetical protein
MESGKAAALGAVLAQETAAESAPVNVCEREYLKKRHCTTNQMHFSPSHTFTYATK